MNSGRKKFLTAVILLGLSLCLFMYGIEQPASLNFDESHYVPAAREFLLMKDFGNLEHPPLGKELIALSVYFFGDQPFGWRFASAIFGSLSLLGIYLWSSNIFRNQKVALCSAVLTLSNQLLFVQSRIAMLDTFMFAFIIYAMLFSVIALPLEPDSNRPSPDHSKWLIGWSGVMLGFAVACKWFGLVAWTFCLMYTLWSFFWNGSRPTSRWSSKVTEILVSLVLIPLVAYILTFTPFFALINPGSYLSVFTKMQLTIWNSQTAYQISHPYMSSWWQWPLLNRPMWYAFAPEANDGTFVRGVILLGNPLVMIAGLMAMLICLRDAIWGRARQAGYVFSVFASFYFSWILIPRKIEFYYYYYPAAMTFGLALGYVLFARTERTALSRFKSSRYVFITLAIASFVYFYPILAAQRISIESARSKLWFDGTGVFSDWKWFER